ncbi:MAG: membrane protein insertase YidC [Paracoccaceae bacterium]|nr:membrane protein insertase YidC [Paracoccaceae bacterium]
MDDQNKNLILAMVLSSLVLVIWMVLFAPPPPDPNAVVETTETTQVEGVPAPAGEEAEGSPESTVAAVPEAERVQISTPSLSGSVSLSGGRIDDLSLVDYDVSLEPGSEDVTILSPVGSERPYYAVFGWVPGGALQDDQVPATDTVWSLESGSTLTPDAPIVLRWDSPAGLTFRRTVEVDDRFMFTVTQSVENTGAEAQRLAPYGLVARQGEPQDLSGFFIIHEGAIRRTDGELQEIDYSDMPDQPRDERWGESADVVNAETSGWVGFTDHYWMTTLIPEQGQPFTSVVQYLAREDVYRTAARMPTLEVAPGETQEVTTQVFAGAKEWEAIRDYEAGRRIEGFMPSLSYFMGFGGEEVIEGFVDSIDWGWFYFLTKPIFFALHEFNVAIGNMGWAIIALTLFIKALLFPLARKSYVSMARMKELQPEMEKLKERAGDDRQKLQQEMMALYKKEKVNPAAGCLPILLQIPIFFSLYKVIFVTIELRHAPWFGPFQDLSAPDPTSIFNFYGWLPWDAPAPESIMALIFIGILPLLLGISMWFQQKLNPAPTDETQRMIFAWMPWVFMFMLGGFASGLVVYWIANNVITFGQQYFIMWRHGYKPDLLGNIRGATQPAPVSANKDTAPENPGTETEVDATSEAAEPPAPPKPKGPTPKRKKKRRK